MVTRHDAGRHSLRRHFARSPTQKPNPSLNSNLDLANHAGLVGVSLGSRWGLAGSVGSLALPRALGSRRPNPSLNSNLDFRCEPLFANGTFGSREPRSSAADCDAFDQMMPRGVDLPAEVGVGQAFRKEAVAVVVK